MTYETINVSITDLAECIIVHNNEKSPKNKTIFVNESEEADMSDKILTGGKDLIEDSVIHGDSLQIIKDLPDSFVDLLIVDPPYNLSKVYSSNSFKKMSAAKYQNWLEAWISLIPKILKPNASIYICCDWSCSAMVYNVASKYFHVINRITWEREKGRGALKNWKNCSEDIWYFSNGDNPKFNLDAVKLKRKVIAPYKESGVPKDWQDTNEGKFRFTSPSNLWTDLTVPFWSMPENTEHPTQKPEKLIAKLVLASSDIGDMVFDPFLGSGTTAVVAKKLDRRFLGVEAEWEYCLISQKRINMASKSKRIQGYENGVFMDRNTKQSQYSKPKADEHKELEGTLL